MKNLIKSTLVILTSIFVLSGCGSPSTPDDFFGEYTIIKAVKYADDGSVFKENDIDIDKAVFTISDELVRFNNKAVNLRMFYDIHITEPDFDFDADKGELSVSHKTRHIVTFETNEKGNIIMKGKDESDVLIFEKL